MRAQAKGGWVAGAIQSMLLPNRSAAAILHQHGSTACTDVTGFGLLGHLIEMIQYEGAEDGAGAEEIAVELSLGDIPALQGAVECVESGILSSLQPQVLSVLHISIQFLTLVYACRICAVRGRWPMCSSALGGPSIPCCSTHR